MLSLEESGLSAETYNRTVAHCVEREREAYSDAHLWAWLEDLSSKQDALLKAIPLAYGMAFSWSDDYRYWRRQWEWCVSQLNCNQDLMDCLCWHLSQRGDPQIAAWTHDAEQRERDNSRQYQFEAGVSVRAIGGVQ